MSITDGIFPAVDKSGIEDADKTTEEDNRKIIGKVPGIDCGNIREPIAHFVKADCETVIPGKNNSYIVLGRDRPGSVHSGYGGKGDTQCGMIDLVVGRMHPTPKENFKYEGTDKESPIMVDPMLVPHAPSNPKTAPVEFATDAARIYISQKTDIDKNFNLLDGKVGKSLAKSGIGIKADAVRIMGTEGIKLITNPDQVNSFAQPLTPHGIDLIAMDPNFPIVNEVRTPAGNRSILKRGAAIQPLVKGDNLQSCLEEIFYEIKQIMSTNQKFVNYMVQFLSHYANHGHPPAVPYTPVREDGQNIQNGNDINNGLGTTILDSYKGHVGNINRLEKKYLKINNPKCYINSKYNHTN